MAIRQYIGARYVPRFMGTYSSTQVYEALDVVDNGLGTSYIAKVPTPAGTPLTNTTYWTIYGASSGAVINLQNQIDTLNSEVDILQDMTNRRFILIGDSYAAGHTSSVADGWVSLLINAFGLTGDQVYYAYDGGYGFVGNNARKPFLDLIMSLENSVVNPDTITDIVVCGGYNDFGQSGVGTAVTTFTNYCKTKYPNAIIHIGMIGYDAQPTDNIRKYIPSTIFEYYVSKPAGRVHILNGVEYALRGYGDTMYDGVHPTTAAYWALGKSIISAVLGGDGFCQYRNVNGQFVNMTDLKGHVSSMLQKTFKHEVLMQFGYDLTRFTFDENTERPTANQWFKVATMTNSIAKGMCGNASELDRFSRPMEFLVYDTNLFAGHHYGMMHGGIAIMDNSIYIRINDVDPSTGGFYVLSNVTSISPWGNVTFNLLEV